MMLNWHRKSYLKTILAVGTGLLVSVFLVVMWIAKGEIAAAGFIISGLQDPIPFWILVTMVSGCALAGAGVVSGGVICLYREWRQYR